MKTIYFFIISLLIASCDSAPEQDGLSISGLTMGTAYHIKIMDEIHRPNNSELTAGINQVLERVDQLMSNWREDSEISHLNLAPSGEWIKLSNDTLSVIELAQSISRETNGAFDITLSPLIELWGFGVDVPKDTIPDEKMIQQVLSNTGYQHLFMEHDSSSVKKNIPLQINLSAIAKGYAVDQLAQFLTTQGYKHYLVEIGGEIRAKGHKPDGSAWKIAIEEPVVQSRQVHTVISLSDMAIATSGDYRNYFEKDGKRFSHTIDPATGRPITHNLASVSVISDTAARADALATALMVMGAEKGADYCENMQIAAYFIVKEKDGFQARYTQAFKKHLTYNSQ